MAHTNEINVVTRSNTPLTGRAWGSPWCRVRPYVACRRRWGAGVPCLNASLPCRVFRGNPIRPFSAGCGRVGGSPRARVICRRHARDTRDSSGCDCRSVSSTRAGESGSFTFSPRDGGIPVLNTTSMKQWSIVHQQRGLSAMVIVRAYDNDNNRPYCSGGQLKSALQAGVIARSRSVMTISLPRNPRRRPSYVRARAFYPRCVKHRAYSAPR